MSATIDRYLVRESARELVRLFEEGGKTQEELSERILAATRRLLARADLPEFGVKRQGNFVNNSKYLYYDGQLEVTLNQMPQDKKFPPHDHGTCEALIVYSGCLSHTVYARTDDGSREGHAELTVVDDRQLKAGDIAVMLPPMEIHSFEALTDDTFVLVVVDGQYKPDRHIYRLEDQSYVLATPQARRELSTRGSLQG
jgi:predicted metal-dependent enzyme (double-stranded beta helix superfamily)